MNYLKYIASLVFGIVTLIVFSAYTPVVAKHTTDTELLETISKLDSVFFNAYNTCDIKTQAGLISEDLEFYHDQGGLSTSKVELLEALKKNICGKVTRELVAGSIEVSEIPGYGAVQMGMHKFYNNQEPNAKSIPSKFVTIWKKNGESYQMTRIISLHKN